MKTTMLQRWVFVLVMTSGCMSEVPEGIAPSQPADVTVKMDFYNRPLPEIPLPNDVATRFDATSATGRRLNASMMAPTALERRVRTLIDGLDGWGVFQPIAIPFTGALDPESIKAGHRDVDYALGDDTIYLLNVDKDSDSFGEFIHLDVGNGNYPVVLERQDKYWENDPRGETISLVFEEVDEDLNGNGKLDEGEDTDADGVLDEPNYLPGANPDPDSLKERADALMTFYEKETHTVIVRPMIPLEERTTYAVVVTRRIKDTQGNPVGSPYPFIHHHSQTEALGSLEEALNRSGEVSLGLDEVAFAFTFTTQTVKSNWKAVRDGLYGVGVQSHLGEEFPPELVALDPLFDADHPTFEKAANPYVLFMEDFETPLTAIVDAALGAPQGTLEYEKLTGAFPYVDYLVMGSFDSPQLFPRTDENGDWLPFNQQSWPEDLDQHPAPTRRERVYFQMMVPKKEVSSRGKGEPAPVVMLGHGYTGDRFGESIVYGSHLASLGIASIAIDCVSHGMDDLSDPEEYEQYYQLLSLLGMGEVIESITQQNRGVDWDRDGNIDSGGDFWTAYLFHTRDVVRQSALDYMQLVRIIRSFDGKKTMPFDLDGDGKNELAGDFDGDGVVDLGGKDATIGILGASLGGIMAAVVAGVDPEVSVSVPIAAGGGLTDVGLRSFQGGVPEAVILRVMGPLYVGTSPGEGEPMDLHTIVTSVNSTAKRQIGSVEGIQAGDTVVAKNLVNGEVGCGYVHQDEEGESLRFRVSVESDPGDETQLIFYKGNALILGDEHCGLKGEAVRRESFESFGYPVLFEGDLFPKDTTLVALAEGLGLRRANPELRRFLGIGQVVLDPADPAVLARHALVDPIEFESTESRGTHMMIVTTAGDMNVPANTGLSIGRAAGIIDYLGKNEEDRYCYSPETLEAYGDAFMTDYSDWDGEVCVPKNQVLLDTWMSEAVHIMERFTDSEGVGVHMDVENLADGDDYWREEIPRLSPPLRIGSDQEDLQGGVSAALFPFPRPEGQHGVSMPGGLPDEGKKKCENEEFPFLNCAEEECDCSTTGAFDMGTYVMNMMGAYILEGGQKVVLKPCLGTDDCDFIPVLKEEETK